MDKEQLKYWIGPRLRAIALKKATENKHKHIHVWLMTLPKEPDEVSWNLPMYRREIFITVVEKGYLHICKWLISSPEDKCVCLSPPVKLCYCFLRDITTVDFRLSSYEEKETIAHRIYCCIDLKCMRGHKPQYSVIIEWAVKVGHWRICDMFLMP